MSAPSYLPRLSDDDLRFLRSWGFGDEVIAEYVRFMTLSKAFSHVWHHRPYLAPSKAVDAVWRRHMENTALYTTFCHNFLGGVKPRWGDTITRDNYVATLERFAATFDGTVVGGVTASKYWPADEYIVKRLLPFTAADLDRPPKAVFAAERPELLVDAVTYHRAYLADQKTWYRSASGTVAVPLTDEYLRSYGLFPGGLSEFKAALVGCHAMHVAQSGDNTLQDKMAVYVRSANHSAPAASAVPEIPRDGGGLVEWLGRFTLEQLLIHNPFTLGKVLRNEM